MYHCTVELEVVGGLKREYDIATEATLEGIKTALTAWLKPYGLYIYEYDDTFKAVAPIVGYIRGNSSYNAIAWIKVL